MTDLASLKRLYKELMQGYYDIVLPYGLKPIPPELSAQATEFMKSAQRLRERYPAVEERRGQQEANAIFLNNNTVSLK